MQNHEVGEIVQARSVKKRRLSSNNQEAELGRVAPNSRKRRSSGNHSEDTREVRRRASPAQTVVIDDQQDPDDSIEVFVPAETSKYFKSTEKRKRSPEQAVSPDIGAKNDTFHIVVPPKTSTKDIPKTDIEQWYISNHSSHSLSYQGHRRAARQRYHQGNKPTSEDKQSR